MPQSRGTGITSSAADPKSGQRRMRRDEIHDNDPVGGLLVCYDEADDISGNLRALKEKIKEFYGGGYDEEVIGTDYGQAHPPHPSYPELT